MHLQDWTNLFLQNIKQTRPLEWIAVSAAVTEVLLAKKNNVLLYPAGIISTSLYIYILAGFGLYAESILSAYYLVMSVYGWVHWIKRKGEPSLTIAKAKKEDWLVTSAIIMGAVVLLFGILQFGLNRYPNNYIAIWDAFVSATGWAGMWLLARRKLENWLVLNVSNIFAIPLLIYKKLPMTACLTLFLFIVAIFGFLEWRKIYRHQPKPA